MTHNYRLMLPLSLPVLCHGRGVSVVVVGSLVADLVYDAIDHICHGWVLFGW